MCVYACRRLHQNTGRYEGLEPEEAVTATQQFWDAFVARRLNALTVDFNWYLKAFVMEVRGPSTCAPAHLGCAACEASSGQGHVTERQGPERSVT